MKQMSYYTPTKNFILIRALVCVHESKTLNSQYLTKGLIWNKNTPRMFAALRDRPQVLYIFGKLIHRNVFLFLICPNEANFNYFALLSYSPVNKLSKNV